MSESKPLTDPELAAMERLADFDLGAHAKDGDGDRLRAMVLEIRMHRDAMAPHLLRAARLYTDELGALRKRLTELEARSVADFHRLRDLEALNEAGARAVDALESIGEQARRRIVDLTSWLRYALEHWAPDGSNKAESARALLDRAEAETPALAGNSLGTPAAATPDDPAK